MMESASNILGAIVLILAGLYQWTPLKEACLAYCQSPLLFIQQQGGFRGDPGGALALGFRHGIYCIGCCWALMALLFVGGVMNLAVDRRTGNPDPAGEAHAVRARRGADRGRSIHRLRRVDAGEGVLIAMQAIK